jgi:hypothetical protein
MRNISEILGDLQTERKSAAQQVEKLDHAIAAIRGLVGNHARSRSPRRKLSAAARKKIAAAQRARWAKVRQQKKAA